MPIPVLHLCCGDSAAGTIREGLSESAVLVLRDDLAVGPLGDVDSDRPDARAAFWHALLAEEQREAIESGGTLVDQLAAEAAALRDLPDSAEKIVIWHGTGAAEQLTLRRALWALRDAVTAVEEVAVGPALLPAAGRRDMAAVAMLPPEAVAV